MFDIPTLKDLMVRARTEFRSNLKGSDAWTWPNNVYASAKVIAGLTFEVFGFMSYVSRQKFAHTAPDIDSLLLHGAEFGIPRKPAAPAVGSAIITAAAAITVDAGAVFRRTDGVQYFASAGGGLLTAGTLTIPIQAAVDGKVSFHERLSVDRHGALRPSVEVPATSLWHCTGPKKCKQQLVYNTANYSGEKQAFDAIPRTPHVWDTDGSHTEHRPGNLPF